MSLLSARNLILPMTERKQVISILLIAFFFGVYRLAGGGISIVSRSAPPTIQTEPRTIAPKTIEQQPIARTVAPRKAQPQPEVMEDDDILQGILGDGASKRAPSRRDAAPADAGQLDDIEKSLGLR